MTENDKQHDSEKDIDDFDGDELAAERSALAEKKRTWEREREIVKQALEDKEKEAEEKLAAARREAEEKNQIAEEARAAAAEASAAKERELAAAQEEYARKERERSLAREEFERKEQERAAAQTEVERWKREAAEERRLAAEKEKELSAQAAAARDALAEKMRAAEEAKKAGEAKLAANERAARRAMSKAREELAQKEKTLEMKIAERRIQKLEEAMAEARSFLKEKQKAAGVEPPAPAAQVPSEAAARAAAAAEAAGKAAAAAQAAAEAAQAAAAQAAAPPKAEVPKVEVEPPRKEEKKAEIEPVKTEQKKAEVVAPKVEEKKAEIEPAKIEEKKAAVEPAKIEDKKVEIVPPPAEVKKADRPAEKAVAAVTAGAMASIPAAKAPDQQTEAEKAAAEKVAAAEKERAKHEKKTGESQAGKGSKSWLFELPIFYLILYGIQHFAFPENHGFRATNPNPYWIGILLFSLRYGTGSGVVSGMVSAALYCWGFQQAGEGYRLEDSDFYFQPGLFVVMGAAIGGVADKFALRVSSLNMRIGDLLEKVRGLQKQIVSEQKVLRAVEQQVVSQMSSIVTLFHGSRELGTLDAVELLPKILTFFTTALKATKTSIYIPQDGTWVLLEQYGWEENDDYIRTEEKGQGLVGRAAAERRVLSIKDVFTAELDGKKPAYRSDAMMAAPICDPDGEPVAVFAVQAMEFMRFNSASVNLLSLLAEWGTESIAKCRHVAELKSLSVLDAEFAVHSTSYFEKQVAQEFGRCQRYALPFSLMFVAPKFHADLPEEKRTALLHVVARVLREVTRKIDVVARTTHDFAPFAVIMTTTTVDNAEGLRRRLQEAFAKMALPADIRLGIGSYRADMKEKEEIIEQARAELG